MNTNLNWVRLFKIISNIKEQISKLRKFPILTGPSPARGFGMTIWVRFVFHGLAEWVWVRFVKRPLDSGSGAGTTCQGQSVTQFNRDEFGFVLFPEASSGSSLRYDFMGDSLVHAIVPPFCPYGLTLAVLLYI
jgi:hypothetical protein